MARNCDVPSIFNKYRYRVSIAAPGSSHHKHPAENSYGYIGEAVIRLMEGGDVSQKLCPYALS